MADDATADAWCGAWPLPFCRIRMAAPGTSAPAGGGRGTWRLLSVSQEHDRQEAR
ncbi:hypothetical protein [Komagataeibacter saccharivorans]|uniref:hypothetical protein n=1 Tax=Komagataeibacter saccharivorans TaxID=265959 RepID=UPI0013C2C334|nr:hypothetical protein [Komagataeibacter saccharivorans]